METIIELRDWLTSTPSGIFALISTTLLGVLGAFWEGGQDEKDKV